MAMAEAISSHLRLRSVHAFKRRWHKRSLGRMRFECGSLLTLPSYDRVEIRWVEQFSIEALLSWATKEPKIRGSTLNQFQSQWRNLPSYNYDVYRRITLNGLLIIDYVPAILVGYIDL